MRPSDLLSYISIAKVFRPILQPDLMKQSIMLTENLTVRSRFIRLPVMMMLKDGNWTYDAAYGTGVFQQHF